MPVNIVGNQYGGVDEFAKAIPAAIEGYYASQDRKMKMMEFQAKIVADQERKAMEKLSFETSVRGSNNLNYSQKADLLRRGGVVPMDQSSGQQAPGVQSQYQYPEETVVDERTPAAGLVNNQRGLLGSYGGLIPNTQSDPYGLRDSQRETEQQLELEQKQVNLAKSRNQLQQDKMDALPLDKKKVVETLATKNANKISIKNQIDAVMGGWDGLSDDQKVVAGRQLIKTLNSTEGADAVGTEEARRLGGKLEFAMGNLSNSNPVQFGRDLKGFKEQARNVSKSIGTSIKSNQKVIDSAYGRRASKAEAEDQVPKQTFKTHEIDWAD